MDDESDSLKAERAGAATPMMAQYLEIKAGHPDALLFYRMGDFYELFFDDAVAAADALGITLTRRGRHQGSDVPMCGVPVHAADDYLHRLIERGFRVAICEQLEDPAEARKRGAKAVVERGVVRLVTPGTLTEDSLLEARAHNFLAALARVRGEAEDIFALAWLDISTGDLAVKSCTPDALEAELSRIAPSELLLSDALAGEQTLKRPLSAFDGALTPLAGARFDSAGGERRLKSLYRVAALDAYGDFTRAELAALGALVDYVALTQAGRTPSIRPPRREAASQFMVIDAATRTNLELTRTLSGARRGSLLDVIDRTVTGAGARELAARLAAPLTVPEHIDARLDAVAFMADGEALRTELRRRLRGAPDLERALGRLALGRGSPRDLGALRQGLALAAALAALIEPQDGLGGVPARIAAATGALAAPDDGLADRLEEALVDDMPAAAREGGFVRAGFSGDLDENRKLRDDSRRVIAGLQAKYAELAGVKSLKVKFNNVLGYFVEVTAGHGERLMSPPLSETFIHRQTMANAVRFTTTELAELERAIAAAADRALAIELEIFSSLVEAAVSASDIISRKARALAEIDVAAALGELAVRENHCRPVVDSSLAFDIRGGRHPMVESALRRSSEPAFVANDCDLGPASQDDGGGGRRLWLLTGPNMAGKSTFLRQNALIAILAQAGAYVPAAGAHIGVVDRLFSRVGASDDLARGRSTFMVEMIETATILNHAGERSLVILDEIGRGTATFDGLSIAWAAVEHLHEVNRARAIFATHYHELTALAETLAHLANVTMRVKEWEGEVVFLHEVAPGAADRSYGIQVARLAGLPPAVIRRAGEVLHRLEAADQSGTATLVDDLPLFSVTTAAAGATDLRADEGPGEAEALIAATNPDEISPREALELIYRLKSLIGE